MVVSGDGGAGDRIGIGRVLFFFSFFFSFGFRFAPVRYLLVTTKTPKTPLSPVPSSSQVV